MLSGNPSVNTMKIGMDIYRAGIGLQECFILTFLFVTAKFHREMLSRDRNGLVDRSIKWRVSKSTTLCAFNRDSPMNSIGPNRLPHC